jgi:hypothetical protein
MPGKAGINASYGQAKPASGFIFLPVIAQQRKETLYSI